MDAFDKGVLGDDEAAAQIGGVVLDAGDQPAALELREQAELTELGKPHRLLPSGRDRSPRG